MESFHFSRNCRRGAASAPGTGIGFTALSPCRHPLQLCPGAGVVWRMDRPRWRQLCQPRLAQRWAPHPTAAPLLAPSFSRRMLTEPHRCETAQTTKKHYQSLFTCFICGLKKTTPNLCPHAELLAQQVFVARSPRNAGAGSAFSL